MMSRDTSDESKGETVARDAAAKLDETAEKIGGTSNIDTNTEVGYIDEAKAESLAKHAADEQGVTLHRNADGSHSAVDDSQVRAAEAERSASAGRPGPGSGSSANDTNKADGSTATDELARADVVKILRDAGSVMLATAVADGSILSHPMTPQEVTEDADVWFFLGLDGDQAKALATNPAVNISVAEAGNWLSVAGRVEFVDDPTKVDKLWTDAASAWFEDRNDPNLALIKVTTDSAQHWGLPGGKVAGLAQIVKAKITGSRTPGGTATTEL